MFTEIITDLYIGEQLDVPLFQKKFKDCDHKIITVTNTRNRAEPESSIHVPIVDDFQERQELGIYVYKPQLVAVSFLIDIFLKKGYKVLLHCTAGIERSPLAVSWYLHKKLNISIEEAYVIVKKKRPQTQLRLEWLSE